jgi:Holliday junction DNA helicase RuvB
MAAVLSEQRDVIEEVIEPYLIQQGFIQRTPRGRMLTDHAFSHLGLPVPRREPVPGQLDLLDAAVGADPLGADPLGADSAEELP